MNVCMCKEDMHKSECMHICIINNAALLRLHSNLTVNSDVYRLNWTKFYRPMLAGNTNNYYNYSYNDYNNYTKV